MSGPSDDRPAGRTQAATRLGVVSRTGFARETLLLAFAGEFDLVPLDLGSGGPDTIERARAGDPDLVLIDLPPAEAGSLAEALLDAVPGTRPVVVHRGLDPEQLVGLAEAGCIGFVGTECGYQDLLRELRRVIHQESNCPPQLAGALIRSLRRRQVDRSITGDYLTVLSPREREVAELLERRYSNKEIAAELGVEFGTVKNHVHNVLTKLGLHNRWELPHLRVGSASANPSGAKPQKERDKEP